MAYTTIDDPTAHFSTDLWTGGWVNVTGNAGSDEEIIPSGFQPDMVWIKSRSATGNHMVQDSSRGLTKVLYAYLGNAEDTLSNRVKSTESTGYTIGPEDANTMGTTYVGWSWKANGGSRTTNTESGDNPAGGYQANTTAGFSIVDYTGTGAVGTMAHGLGAVPSLIIIKNRSQSDDWAVYHSSNTSAPETDYLVLNENETTVDNATWWNDTAPTSSVFTVATAHTVNADAETYIAYCFTPIQGYSKFGTYKGNANADGTFVYTGFKPQFVLLKCTDVVESWYIWDTTRSTINLVDEFLNPNSNNAETENSDRSIDALSNGFKLRGTNTATNGSGDTYVYAAFAKSPFVTSNGAPTNAR